MQQRYEPKLLEIYRLTKKSQTLPKHSQSLKVVPDGVFEKKVLKTDEDWIYELEIFLHTYF